MRSRTASAYQCVALAVGIEGGAAGCSLFSSYEGPVPEVEDIRLEMPPSFDGASGERRELYVPIDEAASDVNGWVGDRVQLVAELVDTLTGRAENSRDGAWRVYGPITDGVDLSWLVRIQGDTDRTDYEIWVGRDGASPQAMDLLMRGGVTVAGDQRQGELWLDFDTVEQHRELNSDLSLTYSGAIAVHFDRSLSTPEKRIDVEFLDFRVEDRGGDAYASSETYAYRRQEGGEGAFRLALRDGGASLFGDATIDRVVLDAAWSASAAGRVRAGALSVDHQSGGLRYGDLVAQECFSPGGRLVWRGITEAYQSVYPEYPSGDEGDCVLSEAQLDAAISP